MQPGEDKHVLDVKVSLVEAKRLGELPKSMDAGRSIGMLLEKEIVTEAQLELLVQTGEAAHQHVIDEKRRRPSDRTETDEQLEGYRPIIKAGRTLGRAKDAAKGKLAPVFKRVGVGLEVKISTRNETLSTSKHIKGKYSRKMFERAWEKRSEVWKQVGFPRTITDEWKRNAEQELDRFEKGLHLYSLGESQERICDAVGVSQTTIKDWLSGRKIPWTYKWIVHQGPRRQDLKILNRESEDVAYLLGVYAATTKAPSHCMRVTSQDKDALEHLSGRMNRVFGVKPRVRKDESSKQTQLYRLEFYSVNALAYMRRISMGNTQVPFEHLVEPCERKAFLQGFMDFGCGVTHKQIKRKGDTNYFPEVQMTFTNRREIAEDMQVLSSSLGIYPLLSKEEGNLFRLHIVGEGDLTHVEDIGFNSKRKTDKLALEMGRAGFCVTDHGLETYEDAVESYNRGESRRSIGRRLWIDKSTPKKWAEGTNTPPRVDRHNKIVAMSQRLPDPDVIGYCFRNLNAPPILARRIAREYDMEDLRKRMEKIGDNGQDPKKKPKLILEKPKSIEPVPKPGVARPSEAEKEPREGSDTQPVEKPGSPELLEDIPDKALEKMQVDAKLYDEIGVYAQIMEEYPILPNDKQHELAVRAQEGDTEAREMLANSNLRYVLSVAKKYLGRGMGLNDLMTEGVIGLMVGVDRYEPDRLNPDTGRPYNVLTYASWWVRKRITCALHEQAKTIRLPAHVPPELKVMKGEYRRALEETGFKPTDDELAERLGWKVKKVEGYREYIERSTMTSLDLEFGPDEEQLLKGSITYTDEDDVPTQAEKNMLTDITSKAFVAARLDERQIDILQMRFGLGRYDGDTHTLEEIAAKHQVTKEKIQQVETHAFNKIKDRWEDPDVKTLMDYAGGGWEKE